MNADNSRDTEVLPDEAFYKDENVKGRLFGHEKTEVSLYKLIAHSHRRMAKFDAESRFMRRVLFGMGTAIIGGLITINLLLWRG